LTESADPLELGNKELIFAEITDSSGVSQVLIEFEGSNHSMRKLGGNIWLYDSWKPTSVGIYPYTIHMEDIFNNWGHFNDSIEVIEGDSDTTPPTYSNLVESADPLKLGDTEIIKIDVSDPSGVSQVLIEVEGSSYSMTNIGGVTWEYDSWTPSSIGTYTYTISMEDNHNNWGFVSGSIQVIDDDSDNSPPTYTNLVESSDPLELGVTEVISIDVTDLSGVKQVLIEFEGVNHLMINIGGDTWQYDSWIPSTTGLFTYVIYMEDIYNHQSFISDSIRVVDTTPPSYIILTDKTNPVELGNSHLIMIKALDISGINRVLIEYEGSTNSLTYLGGDVWQYKDFYPSNIGTCTYTLYIEDNNNNWNSVDDDIEVRDTKAPDVPKLIIFPSGVVIGKIIFDWEDGYDPSGILYYRLVIDNESNPLITPGNIFEVVIENTGSESSYYELKASLAKNTYHFFLYQIDGTGHESSSATGTFTLMSSPSERENQGFIGLPLIISGLIMLCLIILTFSIVISKKIKNGKPKISANEYKVSNFKEEIKRLENIKKNIESDAKKAVKDGNFAEAANLFEECEHISNQLFKKGTITKGENTKYYANMKSKVFRAQEQIASMVTFSINDLLIKYCKSIKLKYYSYPHQDKNGFKAMNGWILNYSKFLQHRLTDPKKGKDLVQELGINQENLSNIAAIHFIYTSDLSINSIIEICCDNQNPETFIFIVGINWPSNFQDRASFTPPEDQSIIYQENIRIININLFADLIGLEGGYRNLFFKIFKNF
ncbi:MAG: hypothetical protein ACFFKA_14570, partial [Candidatus Thorarchaeota archaeon]